MDNSVKGTCFFNVLLHLQANNNYMNYNFQTVKTMTKNHELVLKCLMVYMPIPPLICRTLATEVVVRVRVRVMVFNATFNNIPVLSWWSVLLVEEIGVPRENH